MGYPMAINLRRKLDPNVTLLISDISPAAVTRFQDEASEYGPVEVVQNGFEAAQDAVSLPCTFLEPRNPLVRILEWAALEHWRQ